MLGFTVGIANVALWGYEANRQIALGETYLAAACIAFMAMGLILAIVSTIKPNW